MLIISKIPQMHDRSMRYYKMFEVLHLHDTDIDICPVHVRALVSCNIKLVEARQESS